MPSPTLLDSCFAEGIWLPSAQRGSSYDTLEDPDLGDGADNYNLTCQAAVQVEIDDSRQTTAGTAVDPVSELG